MNEMFEIKVRSGYESNTFFKKDNKLDLEGDLDLAVHPVEIELLKQNENKENDLIATISGCYFDMDYIYEKNVSLLHAYDMYSSETYELYEVLFEDDDYKSEFEVFTPNLFYIDNIIFEKDYRQSVYCTMLVNQMSDILKYVAKLNVGVIATTIYVFEGNDIKELNDQEKQEMYKNIKNIFISNKYITLDNDDNYLIKVLY